MLKDKKNRFEIELLNSFLKIRNIPFAELYMCMYVDVEFA